MMQNRNSSSAHRILLLVGTVAILIVGVLYFMKRAQANRLASTLESVQIERRDKEEQLNGVLTDYQRKIEEMTRQLSDYAAKVTKCEDQKATAMVSLEKLESEKSECVNSQANINKEKEQLQAHVTSLREQHEQVNSQLEAGKNDVKNIQQALSTAEQELEECQDSQEECSRRAQTSATQLSQCQLQHSSCQQQLTAVQQQLQQSQAQGPPQSNNLSQQNNSPRLPSDLSQPQQQQHNPAMGTYNSNVNRLPPQANSVNMNIQKPPNEEGHNGAKGKVADDAAAVYDKEEREILHDLEADREDEGEEDKGKANPDDGGDLGDDIKGDHNADAGGENGEADVGDENGEEEVRRKLAIQEEMHNREM